MLKGLSDAVAGSIAPVALYLVAAADEVIPGWSDISDMAKTSVIGALLLIVVVVIVHQMRANTAQQRSHEAERKADREAQDKQIAALLDAHGKVIDSIRKDYAAERSLIHEDLKGMTAEVRRLAVQCARSQAAQTQQIQGE